ncbi:hypothetical protein [Tissierella sp.]|uniref:hypothetical protein n=1 Tax=Tissierella sp. TaxID=41274 RepID=UPI0028A76780|nr:hypothetical protein [Tissierella sp.]
MDKAKKYVDNFEKVKADNIDLLLWEDVETEKSYFAGCIAKREYIAALNCNALLIIKEPAPSFITKIGGTTYIVNLHFSKASKGILCKSARCVPTSPACQASFLHICFAIYNVVM